MLPSNATAQERALADAAARLADIPAPLRELWNPDTCPSDLLPWLAWAFGVDQWDAGWPEEARRNAIREALTIKRRKGSVWAIKRAIRLAGYGDSILFEGDSSNFHDGTFVHNGLKTYGDPAEWARYRFLLARPISNAQAEQIRRLLADTAPVRCHLAEFVFVEAAHLYNGAITHDGAYNHGVA